ncbi:NHL repeat-containing protein [Aeromonas tecta]|uniref:multiheme c-type cytochrome n=1 Tax=Aeromonas tecta TaxID=324617 RepID=UPI0006819BC1|nr:multiheme c-type cytochrome [Aeromonas tecta]
MLKSLISCLILGLSLLGAPLTQAQQMGSALQAFDQQGAPRLLSANQGTGSITLLARDSGERLKEASFGGDLRQLARADDGTLLVTDYSGDRLLLLDDDLDLKKAIATGHRPYGVIFDPKRRWFWVTLFEAARLQAYDLKGTLVLDVATAEAPRGLALTDDDRLLLTHAMTGQLAIYSLKNLGNAPTAAALAKPKLITLAETHSDTPSDSQGLPRLLDGIALSPDGSEAWLPHVLWSLDHPFQFQSTVFPAVSIIDLDSETERVDERKQLFLQINLPSVGNRSQIVSNPFAARFAADGKRVYLTLAGSEDLLVFDLSRSGKQNSNRHRRKKFQGGAKATQLLRHLPGQNPRDLLIDGDHILVHNVMSQDLTRLASGGSGPFARVTVDKPHFAQLVTSDPRPAALKRGERLFNLGNTLGSSSANGRFPMAGDNWMSCNSCHLDGFNFTNKFLMQAHRQASKDNAINGHANLTNMVAGDFIGEYLRMTQQTQGGMGHDGRDGAQAVDPANPPTEVKAMMEDLHAFVTADGNLPYLANWLRLDTPRTDPAKAPTSHPKEWLNSASCQNCHQQAFADWSDSNHRLMGNSHPYYKAVQALARQTEGEAFGQWCQGCHMPQQVMTGQTDLPKGSHMLEQRGASLIAAHKAGEPVVEEGTGCLLCHRITRLEDAGGNSAFTVNLKDRESYVFEDAPGGSVRHWLAERQINARPAMHKASYQKDFYQDAALCKSCHNEFAPGTGANIVNTWDEWQNSSFAKAEDPAKRRTCIDCHMNPEPGNGGAAVSGQSTENGTVKTRLYRHNFTGAQHQLVGLRNPSLEQESLALLRSSATLSARIEAQNEQQALVVRVANTGAGHALPTGVADFRELWLELTVTDANGQVVLKSGQPVDGAVPEDARLFRKVFGDAEGKPVGLKFWRYAKLLEDTRIPADGWRDEAWPLPADAKGPFQADIKLNFRTYPKWVNDIVRASEPQLPEPPIVLLNRLQLSQLQPTQSSTDMEHER